MFVSAISLTIFIMNNIMYVDNTDMFMTGESNETPESIQKKTQQLLSKWCSMLRITGGALRPKKCWWYLLSFHWDHDGKRKYTSIPQSPASLSIPDYRLEVHTIARHEPHIGKKGLGVYLAPDGNNIDEFKYLETKELEWCGKIATSFLSPSAAYLGLCSTIMASLRYPLAARTFTEKECDKLEVLLYKTILPKMGVNRHIAKVYRYGPISAQGTSCPTYIQNKV